MTADETTNPHPEDPQPDTRDAFHCAVCGRSVADADAASCPIIRIRDMGSLHGTFIGGNLIGKRPKGEKPDGRFKSPAYVPADGVEVRLSDRGQVAFTELKCDPDLIRNLWDGSDLSFPYARSG